MHFHKLESYIDLIIIIINIIIIIIIIIIMFKFPTCLLQLSTALNHMGFLSTLCVFWGAGETLFLVEFILIFL